MLRGGISGISGCFVFGRNRGTSWVFFLLHRGPSVTGRLDSQRNGYTLGRYEGISMPVALANHGAWLTRES
jgi:hypothetical protein